MDRSTLIEGLRAAADELEEGAVVAQQPTIRTRYWRCDDCTQYSPCRITIEDAGDMHVPKIKCIVFPGQFGDDGTWEETDEHGSPL